MQQISTKFKSLINNFPNHVNVAIKKNIFTRYLFTKKLKVYFFDQDRKLFLAFRNRLIPI